MFEYYYNISEDDYESKNRYLNMISRIPLLKKEEEIDLAIRIKNGDISAKEKLIYSNLRLVAKAIRPFFGKGVMFWDLIQEGNAALISAVAKYDHTKGMRFSSYAYWFIMNALNACIVRQGRTIEIPDYLNNPLRMLYNMEVELEKTLMQSPTLNDIAIKSGLSLAKLNKYRRFNAEVLSLNEDVSQDEELELFETISADESFEELIENQIMVSNLLENANLTEREREITIMYFGLGEKKPMVLDEIALIFNLRGERIRQILDKAISKLKEASQKQFESGFYSYQNDDEMLPEILTIYEIFAKYSPLEIDQVLATLSKYEKRILEIIYGPDLHHSPKTFACATLVIEYFYNTLIPKINSRLIRLRLNALIKRVKAELLSQNDLLSIEKIDTYLKGSIKNILSKLINSREVNEVGILAVALKSSSSFTIEEIASMLHLDVLVVVDAMSKTLESYKRAISANELDVSKEVERLKII